MEQLPPLQFDVLRRALRFCGPADTSTDIDSPGGTLTSPGPLTEILPNSLMNTCKVAVVLLFVKVKVPVLALSQASSLLQELIKKFNNTNVKQIQHVLIESFIVLCFVVKLKCCFVRLTRFWSAVPYRARPQNCC